MGKKERATAFMKNNILYVKPESDTYEMIYRSATGVYWDEEEKALYFKDTQISHAEIIERITLAVKTEYGIELSIESAS